MESGFDYDARLFFIGKKGNYKSANNGRGFKAFGFACAEPDNIEE